MTFLPLTPQCYGADIDIMLGVHQGLGILHNKLLTFLPLTPQCYESDIDIIIRLHEGLGIIHNYNY